MKTNKIIFPNIGVLQAELSSQELRPILLEINLIQKNFDTSISYNEFLAGNLSKQYLLKDSMEHLNNILPKYFLEYEREFKYISNMIFFTKDMPLKINKAWVNFQKKHEFNPVHDHPGLLSFLIWIKIPYLIREEIEKSPGANSKIPVSGYFEFQYTDITGRICQYPIPADRTKENNLLIFPSSLNHCVYPFYSSDEYRISVSGNVLFETS